MDTMNIVEYFMDIVDIIMESMDNMDLVDMMIDYGLGRIIWMMSWLYRKYLWNFMFENKIGSAGGFNVPWPLNIGIPLHITAKSESLVVPSGILT